MLTKNVIFRYFGSTLKNPNIFTDYILRLPNLGCVNIGP